MKAKTEPQIMRIQKLIEKLQGYSFVVLYHKGADMKVADFMSRHPDNDMDSPHEIILIAFSLEDLEEIAIEKPGAKEAVEQCMNMYQMETEEQHTCERCCIITREMVARGEAPAPVAQYPLTGVHTAPEHTPQPQPQVQAPVQQVRVDPQLQVIPDDYHLPLPPIPGVGRDVVLPPPISKSRKTSTKSTLQRNTRSDGRSTYQCPFSRESPKISGGTRGELNSHVSH